MKRNGSLPRADEQSSAAAKFEKEARELLGLSSNLDSHFCLHKVYTNMCHEIDLCSRKHGNLLDICDLCIAGVWLIYRQHKNYLKIARAVKAFLRKDDIMFFSRRFAEAISKALPHKTMQEILDDFNGVYFKEHPEYVTPKIACMNGNVGAAIVVHAELH
ncbi:MAG: hypothetical protein Q8Q23_05695 [bacterium]|nr:hypothetical protein [bacterium]